jgi:hypothetical protein
MKVMITPKQKNQAKQFASFMSEVAGVMKKHGVEDMLCVFGLNGAVRNTYIPLSEKGEMELYCHLSDSIHAYLQATGFIKDGAKHTAPISIKTS